jgi:DNA primase
MRADQQPKYLNSPQSEMFDKGANLYALDQARQAIRQAGQAIVVEGYMDALIPHQAGFRNVVATLGTALTERHVQVLRRDSAREVILCLDADLAGIRAAVRGSGVAHDGTADEALRIDFSQLNRWERPRGRAGASAAMFLERRTVLKVMTLEGGKDPDEVVRQDPAEWTRAVAAAQPVIDFVLKNAGTIFDLQTTDGRREAARAAVALIYDVADPIDRDRQLQRLAGVIGTGVDVLQEFARRSIRLVPPGPDAGQPSPVAAPTSSAAPVAGASPALITVARSYEDRLEDLVIALLLRAPEDAPWPEPADFEDGAHRELLERLRAVFPWPDPATALDRLGQDVGDGLAELVERIRAVDEQNERLGPGDLSRELRVRSLELRKLRLFRQHQALDSALREEVNGMSAAERREHHERLARVAADLGGVFAEQRELGVVGSASWSIRRGREVLGG